MGNLRTSLRAGWDPHTSHLKETRDGPLSLFLHDFKEDNIQERASCEALEDHKSVTSMVFASLQSIKELGGGGVRITSLIAIPTATPTGEMPQNTVM